MKLDKVLSLLGLIARARKMITGEELVVAEIQKKRVHLVLLSKDASENTKRRSTINAITIVFHCASFVHVSS